MTSSSEYDSFLSVFTNGTYFALNSSFFSSGAAQNQSKHSVCQHAANGAPV